jgi:Ohr subfamily peroxiredoxin
MPILYTAKVRAEGGRDGFVASSDGLLKLPLALPKSLGGHENATNPEQLFAAGYSACFENAMRYIARQEGQSLTGTSVEATVSLSSTPEGPFKLDVQLAVEVSGLAQSEAEELVAAADRACPYSNAIRNNVDVKIAVTTL